MSYSILLQKHTPTWRWIADCAPAGKLKYGEEQWAAWESFINHAMNDRRWHHPSRCNTNYTWSVFGYEASMAEVDWNVAVKFFKSTGQQMPSAYAVYPVLFI